MIARAAAGAAGPETTVWREYLVRIGLYGEPLRCLDSADAPLPRNTAIVINTDRGEMLAHILQELKGDLRTITAETEDVSDYMQVERVASAEDQQQAAELEARSAADFQEWQQRIRLWKITVELVDLEWTLDGKRLMLYVLNDRGPESTKLALQAAAAGFAHVDVLPVTGEGLMSAPPSSGGGCGCGSGGGGCKK